MNRKSWTEQMIATELVSIISGTGIMPTNTELQNLGRCDLANQVSRNGGFSHWANRLGASRRRSDSDTGWDGEIELKQALEQQGFRVERSTKIKSPYDLRVNDLIRVDVKSARFAKYGPCSGWFYRVGKDAQADLLALYQLDTKDVYFVPWNMCPSSNITISKDGGKYSRFRNRFDIVSAILSHRRAEEEAVIAITKQNI